MKNSKLTDHKFKKGKFITPLNLVLADKGKLESWYKDRLPEYLWIACILSKYGRKSGLEKAYFVLKKLYEVKKEFLFPKFSSILNMDNLEQDKFFGYIATIISKDTLNPLTILYTYSKYPIFGKYFANPKISIVDREQRINEIMSDSCNHQSNIATDMRFLVLYFLIMQGKLCMPKDIINRILKYPHVEHSDETMRIIRPTIRSTEIGLSGMDQPNIEFINNFWEKISKMSDCKLYYVNFEKETMEASRYIELLYEILKYLSDLFIAVDKMDNKKLVLLGITTYSYKRLLEIVEHDLFNTISARSIIRSIIENYIMMKYLLKNEDSHSDIWKEYQYYGIGLYKIVLARSREATKDLTNSHVEYKYLSLIVNEYIDEEFLDMDTSYFDKQNIREKAKAVDETELYGLYYDYDSSFEHGLWGAIRESSLVKCDSPEHQFHCIPDYDNKQNLKSVWHDCINTMNKTILLLNEIYGIPKSLLDEVMQYGK